MGEPLGLSRFTSQHGKTLQILIERRMSRKNVLISYKIFDAYLRRYGKGKSAEARARIWNGGLKGDERNVTKAYWKKVKNNL